MTIDSPSNHERNPDNRRITFVERFATIGHVTPVYQSAQKFQAGLLLSAGSVSTAVNCLVGSGYVRLQVLPGVRHRYDEIGPDGWRRPLAGQRHVLGEIRRVAGQAVEAAGARPDRRLVDLGECYASHEPVLADVLDRVPS